MLLLDTSALIWAELGDRRLGGTASSTIASSVAASEATICPISFWEVGLAVDRRRISLSIPLEQWRRALLASGYREHAITGADTIEMYGLEGFHADPADRLIVAVARVGGYRLITSDSKILAWPGKLDRQDARM